MFMAVGLDWGGGLEALCVCVWREREIEGLEKERKKKKIKQESIKKSLAKKDKEKTRSQ